MPSPRRMRGILLRLVRRRALSIGLGILLVLPAVWMQVAGGGEAWWAEGLGLVLGATGAAFLWVGVAGLGPDWIE